VLLVSRSVNSAVRHLLNATDNGANLSDFIANVYDFRQFF
jgi:hypothetical protein